MVFTSMYEEQKKHGEKEIKLLEESWRVAILEENKSDETLKESSWKLIEEIQSPPEFNC